MKKSLFFLLSMLLLACNQASNSTSNNSTSGDTSTTTDKEPEKVESIDIKSLLSLSPLSIFDGTTEGLSLSEKNELLKNGESASWRIAGENNTKLTVQSKHPSSEVTLRFLKNKDNSDGLLFAQITNEQNTDLLSWEYSSKDKKLQKSDVLKKYAANDFVSKEDKLPESYQPKLHYGFINDETIEVSLNTWMEKEFEDREIINKIYLKWNGERFEEQIVKNQPVHKFSLLDKPSYDLSKLSYEGEIVNKRFWNDANGENIGVFTQKKSELFVYHYAISSDNVRELRKVYDFEKDCDYDLTIEFIEEAIKVTDLDNNNFGEITFAYKKACISDVSPLDLKLLMLENGNKFIIRGTTVIDKPGIKAGGDKNVDPSFNNAPASFLLHADNIWDNIKNE